ncbi:Jasmonate-induced protein-like protein [Bienertia sinuspersici]
MTNAQSRVIWLSKTHDWKGHFTANPSETIGGEADGTFVHEGATSQGQLPVVVGSKGAVVYTTIDRMFPGLEYLLAWYKPENPSIGITRVYVETGLPGKFVKMGWNVIEENLDKSGNTSSYKDDETGATAAAEIKDFGDKAALVGATFDRIIG